MPEKYKIIKVTNLKFVKDNKSYKSTNLQKALQLEEVKQEILTNNFDRINKINSSKNKNYMKKDFKFLLLNLSSLQNLLILLSLSSLSIAAN